MFEQTFRNIDDILYKDSGADSELDYTTQLTHLTDLKQSLLARAFGGSCRGATYLDIEKPLFGQFEAVFVQ